MLLLLHLSRLHINKAFKPPFIGTQSLSSSELYELDSKTLDTSSVYILILSSDMKKAPVLVKVHNDKAYIHTCETTI